MFPKSIVDAEHPQSQSLGPRLIRGVVLDTINAAVEPLTAVSPTDWKPLLRKRILTARQVLLRHPWAPALIGKRSPMTLSVIAYFDAIIGLLRSGGFTYDLAHHAMHTLGSRALGFTQELFQPPSEQSEHEAAATLVAMADRFSNIVGMMSNDPHTDSGAILGWCDDQAEFEFGLDLILDGLDRLRTA